jgi:hypothetical protein
MDPTMAEFQVRRYENGKWDQAEPRTCEATTARQAAESLCREVLTNRGTLGKLRAEVWPTGNPKRMETFYSC